MRRRLLDLQVQGFVESEQERVADAGVVAAIDVDAAVAALAQCVAA